MKEFFKDLSSKIQKAVQADIKNILQEVGEEKIYAVALVTDSDCITLYLALNTDEYMKEKEERYVQMFKNHLTEEDIKKIKDGSKSFTKWIPDEWGYSDGKNSELNKISKLLYEKEESDSEEYAKHIDLFLEAVTSALKQLIEEKTFGERSEEIMYFISMSDDERAEGIENNSARLLNSENLYEKFLKRKELLG